MDTLEQDYLNAILPDVSYILGRRLRPFSLAHWVALKRLGNSFETGCGSSYRDFLEAVWICSHSYEEILAHWGSRKVLRQLRWQTRRHSLFGILGIRYERPAAIFQQYIDQGFKKPALEPNGEGEGSIELNSPMPHILAVHLMEKANQSLSQVMNQPLALSYWIYSTLAEKTGSASLTTADQAEIDEQEAENRMERIEAQAAEAMKRGVKLHGLS